MSNAYTLTDVIITQSHGTKSFMPGTAEDGRLLIARVPDSPSELWCGTGNGVELLSGAKTDLSNLSQTGEDHFVRVLSQVRDCIFKAPNGLPSVSGNVVSLPTGTTLLCANGVDSNRAAINEKITTANAISVSVSQTGASNGILFFDGTYNTLNYKSEGEYFRQITQPTITTTYGMWYNPNTNEYKVTSNTGSTWTKIKAAEIGRFTTNSSGNIDSFTPRHPLVVATMDDIKEQNKIVRNIGEIVASTIELTDAGLHLLDGSLLSGSGSYDAFVSYIARLYAADPTANYFTTEANWQASVLTYGVCGKFVYDSVNNTVRLPKVTGFVEGTIDANALGDLVEAGLPNITGTAIFGADITDTTGALYISRYNLKNENGSGANNGDELAIDASHSNAIYGNSNTVQPQSINVFYYIVVATTTKTDIEVNIDEIATDLNGKADIDLSNINPTQTTKSTIIGWGMPDFSTGVSKTTNTPEPYTAETNGWVTIQSTSNTVNSGYLVIDGVNVCGQGGISNAAGSWTFSAPVGKGSTYKATGNITSFVFYKCKGEA